MKKKLPMALISALKRKIAPLALLLALLAAAVGPFWINQPAGLSDSFLRAGVPRALAQAADGNWSVPVNLSHSGGATAPQMVVTPDGRYHVIWGDLYAGYMYVNGDGLEWTAPAPVSAPFVDYVPRLAVDGNGVIHAFWLGKENVLYYSRVDSTKFADGRAWTRPVKIAGFALALDVLVDVNGRIHIVYLQSEDFPGFPSGIYYLRSEPGGLKWSASIPLYQSPYLRSLQAQSARVQIVTPQGGDGASLYAAFDNPLRQRVMLVRSADGGTTWEQAQEVDTPVDGSLTGGPQKISVNASGANVLLVWQSEASGVNCSQYYQWSFDGGATWQPKQRMLEQVRGCPTDKQILTDGNGITYLITTVNKQVYLLAWNGSQWSMPQLQNQLSTFNDPETFRAVSLACRSVKLNGETLIVLGCDEGQGRDIWFMARQIVDISAWFVQNPVWNQMATISTTSYKILSPVLTPDDTGRVHAFWSQPETSPGGDRGTAIYYARQETGKWSAPQQLFSSTEGVADSPSAAVDAGGQLYLVWSGGPMGQIYVSKASAARALVQDAWSTPVALPSPQPSDSSPEIVIDRQGVIYVAYTVPVNDRRGVYVTWSLDGGESWSVPAMVFDAQAAGWEMVDETRLTVTQDGALHLLWTRFTGPNGIGPIGLYYARSLDRGVTWSPAAAVSDKPVVWSALVSVGNGGLHRLWQEITNGRPAMWHEQSLDNGETWSRNAPVSIFGTVSDVTVGDPAVVGDPQGRLQLMQIVNRSATGIASQNFALQQWIFDGQRWIADQGLDLSTSLATGFDHLAAVVSGDGRLVISFDGTATYPDSGLPYENLFQVERVLEGSQAVAPQNLEPLPLPPANLDASSQAGQLPDQETTQEPQAVLAAPNQPVSLTGISKSPGEPENAWLGSFVGPLAAGLIVLVVFIASARGLGLRRR